MELRRNAQNLKSDSPRAVIDNLREYMIFKNREELAVVKFIFNHLNNDYIETLAKPNAQLSDIDSPSRASEVYAQLWRNPQIRQFFFGQHNKEEAKDSSRQRQLSYPSTRMIYSIDYESSLLPNMLDTPMFRMNAKQSFNGYLRNI